MLDKPLAPTRLNAVTITGGCLGERARVNRTATLPIEYQQCRDTGRLGSWDWSPGKPQQPHHFWDSDVAKWIEAAACSLATHPDPELEARVDAVVEAMARNQQPDGYLNSFFTNVRPGQRWKNLRDMHELYCAGHLMEAAVAYHEATGKRALLDILCRYADHIGATFGPAPGQLPGYPGHEEIELALVKLFRATGERRYLDMARFFVDERGRRPHYYDVESRQRGEAPAPEQGRRYDYWQAHLPVREQETAEGHSVRACYLYAGMADVAAETGDTSLRDACRALWKNIVERRMYITGGVGSAAQGERFTVDYDLPDETAYAETCAAIALLFFAHRMLRLERDGRYADVMEQALYNGILSGVSLDGTRFYYTNPLAVYPKAYGFGLNKYPSERQAWFGCACCPPNIARLLSGLGTYVYSAEPHALWVHLYAASTGTLDLGGTAVTVRQETDYPWDGQVTITIDPGVPTDFALCLRVPGWCHGATIAVNGRTEDAAVRSVAGYTRLARVWKPGDTVSLNLPMPVRRLAAHPSVRHAAGMTALQRGPVVYCIEEADNGPDLAALSLPADAAIEATVTDSPFPGVPVLRARGRRDSSAGWDAALYRPAADCAAPVPVPVTAIPYALWANRGVGEMRVWMRTAGGK